MTSDCDLLRRYADTNSEEAFAELVRRHLDLVYSAALRQVNGDAHLAQDVTQTVFTELARKAESFSRRPVLTGWLYTSAHFAAAKAVRAEVRRRAREQEAQTMRELHDPTSDLDWSKLRPVLDEAMHELKEADREAILLRYFEQRQLAEIGAKLGVSENTARMRVARAVDKLRTLLNRRGVTLTAATLATTLATEAVVAAPAGLAVSVTAISLAGAAAAGTGISATLMKFMAMTKVKAGVAGALVIGILVAPRVVQREAQVRLRDKDEALRQRTDQLVKLQADNERLSKLLATATNPRSPSNDQLSELMRLRGEIGRLQTAVRELTGPKTNEPLSQTDVSTAMEKMNSDRVSRLKQLLETNPSEKIPELQLLTDSDWLKIVEGGIPLDTEESCRIAMSGARLAATVLFCQGNLRPALRQYAEANNEQFPNDLSQLRPYFKSPVEDAILQRYEILPVSQLPSTLAPAARYLKDWVITQKAPVNAALDGRDYLGLKGWTGGAGTNVWVGFP